MHGTTEIPFIEDDDGIVDGAQEGEEGVRPAPKIVKKRRKKVCLRWILQKGVALTYLRSVPRISD